MFGTGLLNSSCCFKTRFLVLHVWWLLMLLLHTYAGILNLISLFTYAANIPTTKATDH